jgi:hypothetical protein
MCVAENVLNVVKPPTLMRKTAFAIATDVVMNGNIGQISHKGGNSR